MVAYLIVLSGGKRLRESGWKIVSLLIILSAAVQAASMSLVVSFLLMFVPIGGMLRGVRHTSSTMKTDSPLAGYWMSRGFSAP